MPFKMDTTDGEDHSTSLRKIVDAAGEKRGVELSSHPPSPLWGAEPQPRSTGGDAGATQHPLQRAARRRPTLAPADPAPACEAVSRPRRGSSIMPLISMASLPASAARPSRDGRRHVVGARRRYHYSAAVRLYYQNHQGASPPSTSLIVALSSTQICEPQPPRSRFPRPMASTYIINRRDDPTGTIVDALAPSASVVTSTIISSAP